MLQSHQKRSFAPNYEAAGRHRDRRVHQTVSALFAAVRRPCRYSSADKVEPGQSDSGHFVCTSILTGFFTVVVGRPRGLENNVLREGRVKQAPPGGQTLKLDIGKVWNWLRNTWNVSIFLNFSDNPCHFLQNIAVLGQFCQKFCEITQPSNRQLTVYFLDCWEVPQLSSTAAMLQCYKQKQLMLFPLDSYSGTWTTWTEQAENELRRKLLIEKERKVVSCRKSPHRKLKFSSSSFTLEFAKVLNLGEVGHHPEQNFEKQEAKSLSSK